MNPAHRLEIRYKAFGLDHPDVAESLNELAKNYLTQNRYADAGCQKRAEALGWTAQDLFGLDDPPEQHGPNYRRLSRYDVTGLIWLLHGRPVVAVIGTAGGGVTFYRMAMQNR